MSVPDETLTLYLTRDGDRWALAGAQRGGGFKPLRPADELLELDRFADGPAELLERIGQALDAREVERLGDRAELTPQDREALDDVARVLEELERGDGRADAFEAGENALAQVLDLPPIRVRRALELAERDGAVTHRPDPHVEGVRYWRLAPAAREETGR